MGSPKRWIIVAGVIIVVLISSLFLFKGQNGTNTPAPSPTSLPNENAAPTISEAEKQAIDTWIEENDRNMYGDPQDTAYAGGTPLFDESTGEYIDKYQYVKEKYPDAPWNK